MTVRPVRLPEDEPAILCFIWGLQKFENAFEPNRRLDPGFADQHWADVRRQAAERGGFFIAEADGRAVGWAFVVEEAGDLFVKESERRYGFVAELFVEASARGQGHGRALIALTGGDLKVVDSTGKTLNTYHWERGKAYWLDADPPGQMHADVNDTSNPIEVIVVELRKDR